MECKSCELCEQCKAPVLGAAFSSLNENASEHKDVMIVGDFPHEWDIKSAKPLSGPIGTELAKLLHANNIAVKDVYVTNLLKCRPLAPNGLDGRPKKAHVDACQMYLVEEIANVTPKVIIILGEFVFRYFYPDAVFTDSRGKVMKTNMFDIPTVATYHPMAMLATSKFDQIIQKDFSTACAVVTNKPQKFTKGNKDYRLITKSLDLLEKVAKRVKQVETFAFDIETHGEGLFNYKLLSIGLSWKKDTGVSIPVYVRDEQKVEQITKAISYEPPERYKEEKVTLKNGKQKIKQTKIKGWLKEDTESVINMLPEEYKDLIAGTDTKREIKSKLEAILDKEPPLKRYWGDQHDHCMALIKEIMECETPKGAHNGAYDVNRLRGKGIIVKNYAWDTILMHHMLDEERPHGLDDLSFVYTADGGYKSEKNKYLKSSKTSWANIPMDVLLPYNAQDADVTFQLYHIFKEKIYKEPKRIKLFEQHIMPAQRMLCDMEFRGSHIDVEWVKKTRAEYIEKMRELKIEFSQIVGKFIPNVYVIDSPEEQKELTNQIKAKAEAEGVEPVLPKFLNMNSTQHLIELFRDYCGVKLTKKTKSGDALDADVLKKIAKKNKAAEVLLEYKKLKKLESTYLSSTLENIDADGKLHTEFLLYSTKTSRLSSRNPNCFDKETEVLTDSGFKLFSDLTDNDLVAQWENNTITFAKPLAYIKNKYTGNLCRVRNQHTDICGTPDHRCLLFTRRGKEVVTPLSNYKPDMKQMHCGIYTGGKTHIEPALLRLIVATQADGYYAGNAIEFSFKKDRKIKRMYAILNALSVKYTIGKKKDGGTRIYIGSYEPVVAAVKKIIPNKVFTEKLLDLDYDSRAVFIDELNHWDGASTRPIMYASSVYQNVNIVQTLLAMHNIRTCFRKRHRGAATYYYVDATSKHAYSYTTFIQKTSVPYDDYVYCVTMPKDTVVIRRNGCIAVTKNCQNLPSDVKEMFIPPSKDYLCVNVDQSAAELHVLCWMAQDHKMMDIFEHHRDLHRETAASVFGKKAEDITDAERKIAKRVSFGTAYSISGKGLADLLEPEGVKITENQGNKFIEKWRETYKGCARYLDNAAKTFARYGYLETPFGRRRHKYKKYADAGREAASERQSVNFPIQSSASDIQVYEMVHMYKTLVDNGVLPVLTVHDSIVMYCPKDKLKWLRDYYHKETCRRFPNEEFPGLNNCLMYTEMEVGRNYGEHVKLPYDCDFEKWKEENKFLFE